MNEIQIIHQGRGGYVELEGYQYAIEMFVGGSFEITFPNRNRHPRLQVHLEMLTKFASEQDPAWSVLNQSRIYRL